MTSLFFILFFVPVSTLVFNFTHGKLRFAFMIAFSLCFLLLCGIWIFAFSVLITLLTFTAAKTISKNQNNKIICNITFISSAIIETVFLAALNHITFFDKIIYADKIIPLTAVSFICMQSIAFLDETRCGEYKNKIKFANIILYMIWYPKFLMGPLISYKRFVSSLKNQNTTYKKIGNGAFFYSVGLAEKVIITDSLLEFLNHFSESLTNDMSFVLAWFTALVSFLYIATLFSSYSYMARGLSLMAGINIPQNNSSFFFCENFTELNKKQNKSVHKYIFSAFKRTFPENKFTVHAIPFCVCLFYGLWLGFDLQTVLFGIVTGIFTLIETFFKAKGKLLKQFIRIITLVLLCVLSLLLMPKSISGNIGIYEAMIYRYAPLYNSTTLYYIFQYAPAAAIALILSADVKKGMKYKIFEKRNTFAAAIIKPIFIVFAIAISCLMLIWN